MSPQYTVTATAQAEEAGAVALAVASLPASFGPAGTSAAAQVSVIAGRPGWTARVAEAIEAGARGVVVVNPVPEDTGALAAAAEAARVAVVLDQRWAANPALVSRTGAPDAREAMRSAAGTAAMLDSVATSAPGTDPHELLGEHIAALTSVTGPLDNLRLLRIGRTGYTASGRLANGAPIALQAVLTAARPGGVDIRLYTSDGGVSITVPDPMAAWPAEVRVRGPQGEVLLPTLFESSHRASWRRLKDHLDAGTVPADLADFDRLTDLYARLS